jgi:hypothetical protein
LAKYAKGGVIVFCVLYCSVCVFVILKRGLSVARGWEVFCMFCRLCMFCIWCILYILCILFIF